MTRPSHVAALLLGFLCAGQSLPARAELPQWLRKHNRDVDDGNDALIKGDAKGALEAYNRAARRLPDAPGLALDRGIALLKEGEYGKAREALLAATVPSTSTDVRADAYHNLALSFYREADGLAGDNQHEQAQKLFREAVDAAKRALHLRPGDPNVAWNLELAARRMRDEEQKKKEEDEQKKQDQKDKDQTDQKDKDHQQSQDQQNQGQQNQDQQDPQQQDNNQTGDQKQDKQDDAQKPEHDPSKEQAPPEQNQPPPPQEQQADQAQDQAKKQALPREAKQALDALENSEENFERYRARQRANRERRVPEKDW